MDETLNRIIELLDKSGMKKIEFLTKLGLSRSAWGAWTSGRMQSYKKMLPEIADIFGVSLDWISGNEQKTSRMNAGKIQCACGLCYAWIVFN